VHDSAKLLIWNTRRILSEPTHHRPSPTARRGSRIRLSDKTSPPRRVSLFVLALATV
jgi:hypothetical protein